MIGSPAPNRPRRSLTPVASAGASDGFAQGSVAPVLRDDWPDGFDYMCGHCGEVVLASCVADDQLWDLAFQCAGCKGVSLAPALPPAMVLPPGTIVTLPGLSPISSTIGLRRQVLVGRAAVTRSEATMQQGATFGSRAKRTTPPVSDATHLTQIIEQMRQLLGPTFDRLETSDRKGRKSKTPPKQRHPLMVAVHDIRTAIATFATRAPTVDDRPVLELVTLLHTLERWESHPFWPKMVEGLASEYVHTVVTLAAATALVDLGNGMVFQETASHPTPDLRLVVGARQRVAVEVKAPLALRAPDRGLGYDALYEVIEDAVKRAGTGKGGQLAEGRPALLVIGAFHLKASDVKDFERAATDYLRKATEAGKHSHLMGIALLVFDTTITRSAARVDVLAYLNMRVTRNPGYTGGPMLKEGGVP